MIDRGSQVSRALVATLKPEERVMLANQIRERIEQRQRRWQRDHRRE